MPAKLDARGNARVPTDAYGCYQTSAPNVFAEGRHTLGPTACGVATRESIQAAQGIDEFLGIVGTAATVCPRAQME